MCWVEKPTQPLAAHRAFSEHLILVYNSLESKLMSSSDILGHCTHTWQKHINIHMNKNTNKPLTLCVMAHIFNHTINRGQGYMGRLFKQNPCAFHYLCVCVCMLQHAEVRWQASGASSLSPPCGSWRLNLGGLVNCQQSFLTTEPSRSSERRCEMALKKFWMRLYLIKWNQGHQSWTGVSKCMYFPCNEILGKLQVIAGNGECNWAGILAFLLTRGFTQISECQALFPSCVPKISFFLLKTIVVGLYGIRL